MSRYGFDDDEAPADRALDLENKLKIEQLLAKVKNENPIHMEASHTRNLIFVGRARAGKTTTFSMLSDPTHLQGPESIFRGTISAKLHPFCMVTQIDGQQVSFNINIIDTPGLFENVEMTDEKRENDKLLDSIKQCMEAKIVVVHGIFFVCSFLQGVLPEDVRSMLLFADLFKGAATQISMIVSRAESLNADGMEKVVGQIKACEPLKPILNLISPRNEDGSLGEPRVFFAGCLPRDAVREADLQVMQNRQRTVNAMRKRLFGHIFKLDEDNPFDLRGLPLAGLESQEAVRNLAELEDVVKRRAAAVLKGKDTEAKVLEQRMESLLQQLERQRHYLPSTAQSDVDVVFRKVFRALRKEELNKNKAEPQVEIKHHDN